MTPTPMRLLLAALLLMLASLCPRTAHAADPVVCSANISAINFGTIDPSTSGNVDVNATLSWTCVSNTYTDYYATACFNIGNGPLGLDASGYRQITGPGGNLSFQIYRNAARTNEWGAVSTAAFPTPAKADFAIGAWQTKSGTIPVYVRLFGNQSTATAGTYSSIFSTPQVSITGELNNKGYGSCETTGNSDAGNFSPLSVTANVKPNCTVTATDLDFGSINGFLNTNYDQASKVYVTCVKNTAYKVGLDNGLHYDGTSRQMSGSGGVVAYALYHDSIRSQSWGNAIGTDTVSATSNGNTKTLTVYGRVPPQTTPPAGTYQDTVTVLVTY